MKKVIIQGVPGSFHEEAAQNYFKGQELAIVPAHSFRELMQRFTKDRTIDYAVMAIENSIGGSILHNYKLLQESGSQIIGEIYLKIEQHLLALPGVRLEDLKEVHSHPMAIKQCHQFFQSSPLIRLVESEDTALSAALIHEEKLLERGAIAGKRASEIYGLNILRASIETDKNNYTRFFILQNAQKSQNKTSETINKSSIYFRVKHKAGSLASVLTYIAEKGINLSKIQSFPIPNIMNEYYIHADVEYTDRNQFEHVLENIQDMCITVGNLGSYKKAKI